MALIELFCCWMTLTDSAVTLPVLMALTASVLTALAFLGAAADVVGIC
jgi:hypothetical protein